jgi:hypothetical protein
LKIIVRNIVTIVICINRKYLIVKLKYKIKIKILVHIKIIVKMKKNECDTYKQVPSINCN